MNKKTQSSVWAFNLDKINLFSYWDKLFTPEECAHIIKSPICFLISIGFGPS